MSKLENIKDNLAFLVQHNPEIAKEILKLKENQNFKKFELCNTAKGELNIKYFKKPSPVYFHCKKSALKESEKFVESIQKDCQVIYILGAGLGYSYLYLKKWLEKKIEYQLVFIEPHLGALFCLLQTDLGKKIVHHPRIHFYTFSDKKSLNNLIKNLPLKFSLLKASVAIFPLYKKLYPTLSKDFSERLLEKQDFVSTCIHEALECSFDLFRNFFYKSHDLNQSINTSAFKNALKDTPCIICGAGPSLKKNQHLLSKLKNKAFILAGSSAIPGLISSGFMPHAGNFFDPYERLYDRFINSCGFELPTFHSARTYYEVAQKIHGPKLYSKGSDKYPIVDWVENNVGFKGDLVTEHMSVSVFNTSLALHMGCNPIIYVGLDLAYTDNQSYMSGIVEDTKHDKQVKHSDSFQLNEELQAVDIYKNPILSKFGWIMESRNISLLRKNHPQTQFINATEGGIGIEGIENKNLQDVADQYLLKSHLISEKFHALIQEHTIEDLNIFSKAQKSFKEFKSSLTRIKKLHKKTLDELQDLKNENNECEIPDIDFSFIDKNLIHVTQELAYQYLMKTYHQTTDIALLKFSFLKKMISFDSPKRLKDDLKINDMLNRFESYYQKCDQILKLINTLNKKIKQDQ